LTLRSFGPTGVSNALEKPGIRSVFAHPIGVRRRPAPLDESERRRHKIRNVLHSILLLGGIIVLLELCGWALFGPDGLVGMALGAALAFAFSPRISPRLVLRMYGARQVGPQDLPEVRHVLAAFAERAGLERAAPVLRAEYDSECIRRRRP
jgi:hypothetical protein